LDKETRIVTLSEQQQQQQPPPRLPPIDFNFITECFFLTHNSLRLAYITLYQKLLKINQELSRWQSTYQQLVESGSSSDPNQARLKTLYEKMTCEFLNVKSALLGTCIIKPFPSKGLKTGNGVQHTKKVNSYTKNITK
jgi:hypothetical protein